VKINNMVLDVINTSQNRVWVSESFFVKRLPKEDKKMKRIFCHKFCENLNFLNHKTKNSLEFTQFFSRRMMSQFCLWPMF